MRNRLFLAALRRVKSENGQVLIITALSLTVLLGFVALATDVGMLLHEKRILQTAADSAAIAGAAQLGNAASNPGGGATHCITSNDNCWYYAALAEALQNGVPNSAVTPHNPPSLGPNTGSSSYVEVLISQSQPTVFMRMFGLSSLSASARAVATIVPGTTCVYTLGSSGTDIGLTGSGSLSIPSCGIVDDSSSSSALNLVGSGSISASNIQIVGNYNSAGSGTISPSPTTGISSVADPLASQSPPSFTVGSCHAAISYTGSTSHTVTGPSPAGGTICYNGFSNTGSGSVTFPAGVYVINGDFSNTGSGTVSGTGVTFYSPSGSVSVTGSGALNLSAPTSGPTNGILFYQNPTDTNTVSFTGSASSTVTGIVYAPGAPLNFTGSGGATYNTDLIVKSLTITGSATINNYSSLDSPLSTPRLVE